MLRGSGSAAEQAACPPLPRRLVAVQPYLQQLAVSGIGEQVRKPSGPTRTSRIRAFRSLSRRSSPTIRSPSSCSRISDRSTRAPMNRPVLPGRETLGVVERHAADTRRFVPDVMGRLGALHGFALGLRDRQHAVVDAMGRQRPAIVLAGLRDVDLVATTRAMFVRPEHAAPGVERGPC